MTAEEILGKMQQADAAYISGKLSRTEYGQLIAELERKLAEICQLS